MDLTQIEHTGKTMLGRQWFGDHVVDEWSKLPGDIVSTRPLVSKSN